MWRMDGPRGYYVRWNKSDRERQIPHSSINMQNLKNKINEQIRQRQSHTYRKQISGCQGGGDWGDGWKRWRD